MYKVFLVVVLFSGLYQSVRARNLKKFKSVKQQYYSRVDAKTIHFGFTVGINYLDFAIKNSDYNAIQSYRAEQIKFTPGVTLSIISEWNINKDFGLRFCPGIILGKRNITYVNVKEDFTNSVVLKSNYIDLPIYIKYKSKRVINYRPYLIGGMSLRYDLSPHNELNPTKKEILKLDKYDVSIELGAGIDFYLYYFKLSTELKLSVGLKDIAIHILDEDFPDYHEYTKAINKLNSKIVTLSFHFE